MFCFHVTRPSEDKSESGDLLFTELHPVWIFRMLADRRTAEMFALVDPGDLGREGQTLYGEARRSARCGLACNLPC